MTEQPSANASDPRTVLGSSPFASRERPLPLRQMGIGEIVDAAVKLYRREWLALIGIAAIVLIPITFIQSWVTQATLSPDFETATSQVVRITVVFAAIEFLIVQPFLAASITRAAADVYLGERVSIGRTYRFALSRLLPILWISILATIATLAGFILLVLPGILVAVRLALVAPALVVENVRGTRAIGRSWRLTAGNFWRVLGTLFLAGLLASIVSLIFSVPAEFLATWMGPDGWLASTLGTALATVIVTPFSTLIEVLLYFDLRIRKEGFDIEVMAQELAPTS